MPRVMQDPRLFQGDMILPPTPRKSSSRSSSSGGGQAVSASTPSEGGDEGLWPNGKIFYHFSFKEEGLRNLVRRAMAHIEARTCVRFVERGLLHRFLGFQDFVHIFKGKGCYSMVGRAGGSQPLSLGPGCENENIVMHELLHATGLFHLHSRHDRDSFLDIHWHAIHADMRSQFDKLSPDLTHVQTPFDYKSLMLYGPTTFSIDDFSTTMSRKDGGRLIDIPFKQGLSRMDAYIVDRMYGCEVDPQTEKEVQESAAAEGSSGTHPPEQDDSFNEV